jgi:EF hand associated
MERAADSVTTQGITRNGFMQLQAMMIQQQRLDICWTMLRSFGYNRQLRLKPEMLASIKDYASDPVSSCTNGLTAAAMWTSAQSPCRSSATRQLCPALTHRLCGAEHRVHALW